jgi:hypothetical protein
MTYDSKRALLGSIIDYAGTFPPAALSLDKALQRASSWRKQGKHPWLMNKMVLPVADIKKLSPSMLYSNGADGSPWLMAALGTACQSDNSAEFYKTVEWDLRELRRCQEKGYQSSCRLEVVSYETKLPSSVVTAKSSSRILDFISPVLERTAHLTSNGIKDLFFEVSLEGDFKQTVSNTTKALVDWLDENDELDLIPGIKFRTGGTYLPSSEELAEGISQVTSHGLRFKATQGLHHAVTQDKDFGFVNLFSALALAQGYGPEKFGTAQIKACLEEMSAKKFKFEKNQFSWNEFSMTTEEIEVARRSHGATFGSCSLDEPDESLSKELP